jgi:hypothetical protein
MYGQQNINHSTVKKLLVAYIQGLSLLAEELLASQKDSAASVS